MWAVCNQVSPPFPIDCWVKIIWACCYVCPPSCRSLLPALSLNFSFSDSLSSVLRCCFALNELHILPYQWMNILGFQHQSEGEWETIWCITNNARLKRHITLWLLHCVMNTVLQVVSLDNKCHVCNKRIPDDTLKNIPARFQWEGHASWKRLFLCLFGYQKPQKN